MRRLLLLLSLVATPALAGERRYPVPAFERIRVQGAFDVHVVAGDKTEVRVSGSGDLSRVSVRAEGGVLTLGGASGTDTMRIDVTAAGLRAASVASRGRLTIDAIAGERVDLAVNGFGTLEVRGIEAAHLVVAAAGAGSLVLAGEARDATVRILGQFEVDASGLPAGALTFYSENVGSAKVSARERARITNIGPGSVTVGGNAVCEIHGKAPVACAAR